MRAIRGHLLSELVIRYGTASDGAGTPQPLIDSKNLQTPYSFAPDGKRVAWNELSEGLFSLWTATVESDGTGLRAGKPEVILQTSDDEEVPMFSPDGRWLAYLSRQSGTYQVYVRAFPDRGAKWQVSNDGGYYPIWSRNGRDLFFVAPDARIMVAAYTVKSDSFKAEKPRVWSDKQLVNFRLSAQNYDVAPDGKRVAALIPVETPAPPPAQNHVEFLMNFRDELRRKIPPSGR